MGPTYTRDMRRKGAATRRIRMVAPRGDVGFVSTEFVFVPVSSDDVTRDLYNSEGISRIPSL